MSFTEKLINVQLNLASGNFQGGGNTTSVTGLRVSATIIVNGGIASGTAEIAIYGLPLETMNQMSTIGTQYNRQDQNKIALYAGDAEGGMNLVFNGIIHTAYVDAQSMPQVAFRISAVPSGVYWAVKPVPPISMKGPQDVATMMKSLASQMGLQFENSGVNVKLVNPYYGGSPWTQAVRIMKHANIEMVVQKGKMAISPAGTPRQGGGTLISPQTGMVGYPAYEQASIIVRCLFNPSIECNQTVQIQSDLTPANGTWTVNRIVYELESHMPGGKWFQTLKCVNGKAPEPS